MIKCPEKCLVCGADWQGGSALPGSDMEEGKRVFYECGASILVHIIKHISTGNAYQLFIKGCDHDH
jgi:hypothetical protein